MYETLADTVVASRAPRCSQAFFLYTGLKHGLMMEPWQFLKQAGLADRNLAIFRDPHGAGYRRGFSPSAPTKRDAVAWKRSYLLRNPQVSRLYCIGTSSGGYPAIYYGHQLRAQEVWTFGARPIGPDLDPNVKWPPTDPTAIDELNALLSQPNGVTTYRIFYVPSNDRDREVAESIAHNPGVELCPVRAPLEYMVRYDEADDWDHQVIPVLAWRDELAGLFPAFAPAEDLEPIAG